MLLSADGDVFSADVTWSRCLDKQLQEGLTASRGTVCKLYEDPDTVDLQLPGLDVDKVQGGMCVCREEYCNSPTGIMQIRILLGYVMWQSYLIALHCNALHCISLHCITLHCILWYCIALCWSETVLYYIALYCINESYWMNWIELKYIALYCIAGDKRISVIVIFNNQWINISVNLWIFNICAGNNW